MNQNMVDHLESLANLRAKLKKAGDHISDAEYIEYVLASLPNSADFEVTIENIREKMTTISVIEVESKLLNK